MNKISIKTKEEIEIMRIGGGILAAILNDLKSLAKEGVDEWDFEEKFLELCNINNVIPACKNYAPDGIPPFPTGLCFGVNSQSVHNFPQKGKKLKNGDVVTIDTDIGIKGMYLDSSISFGIGNIGENKKRLIMATQKALDTAISKIKDGVRVGVISNTIQSITEKEGFSVLTDYAGHGIGRSMHEAPDIPCYGYSNNGPLLKEGMTICVEPLVCEKSNRLKYKSFWETETVDGGCFSQIEHTVLVTKNGCEILTKQNVRK